MFEFLDHFFGMEEADLGIEDGIADNCLEEQLLYDTGAYLDCCCTDYYNGYYIDPGIDYYC